MLSSLWNPSTHLLLASFDGRGEIKSQGLVESRQSAQKQVGVRCKLLLSIICMIIFALGFAFEIHEVLRPTQSITVYEQPKKTCKEPRIRREWRSLSNTEKATYIAAAKCLTLIPSSSGTNRTVHDEFSYVHSKTGKYSNLSPQNKPSSILNHHIGKRDEY